MNRPLFLYAGEDKQTYQLLNKHLYTLGLECEGEADGPYWTSHVFHEFQEGEGKNFIIILWSVDQLVAFKQRGTIQILDQLIKERKERFNEAGIVSIIARPCAYEQTVIEQTEILSHSPIMGQKKRDQICLDLAEMTKPYLKQWDSAIRNERGQNNP